MGISNVPEPLRRRAEEAARQPAIEVVRSFLGGHLADAETLDEVRDDLRRIAQTTVRGLRRDLAAIESILAEPAQPGVLAQLVAWDANWVLDDASDAAAAVFLRRLADLLSEVIAERQADGQR